MTFPLTSQMHLVVMTNLLNLRMKNCISKTTLYSMSQNSKTLTQEKEICLLRNKKPLLTNAIANAGLRVG